MDVLHAISIDFAAFLNSVSDNFWLSVGFIFLASIGEAVFILGLFVPSTPVLLIVGTIIATGKLPFWPIYLAAVAGAVLGDAISYAVGHALKQRIRTVWPFRNYLDLLDKGEVFFARHGGKSVFIGRFIPGVKAVVPGIAGIMGMSYRWFSIINISSALTWAAAHIVPAMLLSSWLDAMGLSIEMVIVVGTLALTVLFLVFHYHRRVLLLLGGFGRSLRMRWQKPDPGPIE